MTMGACIPQLLGEGKLTQDQADQAMLLFQDLEQDFRRQFGDQTAAAMASDAALKALQGAAVRKRFLAGKTIAVRQRIEFELRGGGNGGRGGGGGGNSGAGGPIDPARGPAFFAPQERIGFANVEGRRLAITRRAQGMIAGLLQEHHTDPLGRTRNEAGLDAIGGEVMGEASANPNAKAYAQSWLKAAEMLRQRFNAAGGNIGQLRGGKGYLPQTNDPLRVRAVPFEEWRADRIAGLDREAMIDRRTGLPLSDAALEMILQDAHEQIRTDGWFKRKPGGVGSGMMASRHGDPRVFIAKDYASWKAYNDKYGRGSLFDAMNDHIKSMASDTAALEIFGPNPSATIKWLKDLIEQDAAITRDLGEKQKAAGGHLSRMDALWGEYTGLSKRPSKEWVANIGQAVRSYETARTLGSAIISAVPGDIGTQHMAAAMWDLPFTKIMQNQLKLLNPFDSEHRLLGARMLMIQEGWTNRAAGTMRALGGDDLGAGRMAYVAETVLRGTGLTAWTDAGQGAWGMSVLGHMADMREVPFNKLDQGFRELLERGGIAAVDWDRIRETAVHRAGGQDWLFAQDIADHELGDRVLAMIGETENLAVQEATFETRAIMHDGLKSGTALGETVKTSLLLKSFGISMMMTHGRRMMAMGSFSKAGRYAVRAFITLTLAGALTIQLRHLVKGEDFQEMDPRTEAGRKFWYNATLQGGGWGMLGDLIGLVANPRLDSFAKWLAGPAADSAADWSGVLMSSGQSLAYAGGMTDKPGNPGAKLTKVVRDQLPGGNIWYTRLAFNRLVVDQLREATDPDYRKSWKRMEKAAEDNGTGYWWAPGETAPGRAPDLSITKPKRAKP